MIQLVIGIVIVGLVIAVLAYDLKYYLNQLKWKVDKKYTTYRPPYLDLSRSELIRVIVTPRLAMEIEQSYAGFKVSWHRSGEANLLAGSGYSFDDVKQLEISELTRSVIHEHQNIVAAWWKHGKTDDLFWKNAGNQVR